ncbi:MAG: acyltransferase [Thermoguttaceae bacterium]
MIATSGRQAAEAGAQGVVARLAWFRNAFGRVTSSGRFIPAVDGLRFVAIFSVVLYHLNDYLLHKSPAFTLEEAKSNILQRVLACGGCGVQLFFVISGFIIGLPFAEHYLLGRPRPSLQRYFSRCFLRIQPPYVINLLLAFLLLVIVNRADAKSLLPNLAASLFYVHSLIFGEMSHINCVAWFLEIVVQFYILAPFMAMVFAVRGTRPRRAVLLGGILLLIGLRTACPGFCKEYFRATILLYLDFFFAGFLLADFFVMTWNEKPSRSLGWDVIALAAWCGIVGVQFHETAKAFLPLVILVAYMGVFRGTISQRCFSQPWIVTIGGICYTIYLYHFFIISAVGRCTVRLPAGSHYLGNVLFQAALILPCVLIGSAILFLLFEKPFMAKDWPARWKSRVSELLRPEQILEDVSAKTANSEPACRG